MDRVLFERLAVEMRRAGVEELGLFYLGESMLLPWLKDAVLFAKEVAGFPYVFLTTNGSLAKPRRVRELFDAGLNSLKFSLNYADAAQFKEIAGMDARLYPIILGNIKAARVQRDEVEDLTGHRCGLYASYIEYDGDQRVKMEKAVAEVAPYLDQVYGLPLYNQAELVGDAERSRGWNVTAGNQGRIGALRDPLPCWAAFTEGHITWDGMLSACCFDHDGRFHMGNLNIESFVDAWNSPIFRALRSAHIKRDVKGTPCETCVAYA